LIKVSAIANPERSNVEDDCYNYSVPNVSYAIFSSALDCSF